MEQARVARLGPAQCLVAQTLFSQGTWQDVVKLLMGRAGQELDGCSGGGCLVEGAAAKAMRALSLPVGTPLSITKTSTSGPVLGSLVHIWSAGGGQMVLMCRWRW